jgi:phage/plasmid primase-like uncharacterized protein
MTDLTNILGGPWEPPAERRIATPDDQLRTAMIDAGIEPPDEILLDGQLHRFRTGSKGAAGHGDKTGWYVCYGDGIPAGRFGDWRTGDDISFRADVGRKFSPAEEMAHTRRMAEAKAARDAEIERRHETAAHVVERIWSEAQPAIADHPYLSRKGIRPHGARVTGDGRLVVPLYTDDGELSSLQYIAHDGGKLYHPGGQTGGMSWMLGSMDDPGPIYIAEGFATAATIHETTGRPCVVAYSASNLVPVTGSMRERYGASQSIVVVADHDQSGVGQRYAEQASAKYGARVVMPPLIGDANDYAMAGHDLAGLLSPPADDWLIQADDFSAQPAPISWLVKRWIQSDALIMVHGPSGGGKTFVVLDWCLRMASAMTEWCGQKVRPSNVVYLAGEGHHGLRGRIAAWKHHHQSGPLAMWLSRDGCDLNTPTGYLKVVDQVRALANPPAVIVVDTLHRFLLGDENSAQDAKTMLDACGSLMGEFGCSVILVHHTGVSDEAQHRARGSSAWRGALDIEISIIPGKDDRPMEIVQRKSKDAEIAQSVHVELQQVTIPGWIDEDGQPVTSAIVIEAAAPVVAKKDSKIDIHRKTFEGAWWATGAEERDGMPYVSRSAMVDYLVTKMGIGEKSAMQYIKPSAVGKLIADLLIAGMIESFDHGWAMVDESQASAMLIRKSGR